MSELSQEARDLIENAIHADDPTDADRSRMRARLAAQLGAAAVASTLGAAHSTLVSASAGGVGTSASSLSAPAVGLLQGGGFAGLIKVAVVTGLAGVIGGSVAWFARQPELGARIETQGSHPTAVAAQAPALLPAVVTPLVEPLTGAGAAAAPEAKHEERTSEVSATRTHGSTRRAAPGNQGESTLADELSLLARAQQALRDGNPALALSHAGQHRERFARGSLREERLGIEALARCALGHDATEVIAALARLAPGSPLLVRVRTACKISP